MYIENPHTVSEILRFALDDNKNKQETRLGGPTNALWRTPSSVKAHEEVHQSALLDSSRRIGQKLKSIFKKPFSFSKMLCQVFNQLFLPIAKNVFSVFKFKDYGSISIQFDGQTAFFLQLLGLSRYGNRFFDVVAYR